MTENSGNNVKEYFEKFAKANGEDTPEFVQKGFEQENQNQGQQPGGSQENEQRTPQEQQKPNNDLSEQELLASIQKLNPHIKSLDELKNIQANPPAHEPAPDSPEAIELRKKNIRDFASKKQINVDLFDQFDQDKTENSIEIGFKIYAEERKNETNETTGELYTEEELREEYMIEYNLTNDPESPAYKRAIKNLDMIKSVYMKDKYKDITSVESEYEAESNVRIQKAEHENLVTESKNKLVENGLSYSIEIAGSKDEDKPMEIKLPISQSKLSEIQVPVGTEDVQSEVLNQYVAKNIGSILYEVANTYHAQMLKLEAQELSGITGLHGEGGDNNTSYINPQFRKYFENFGNEQG